ncbi:MAG: hypothetical protein RL744_516 [Pseudomonadota bacterium]|jgi:energy-coupling factor transporter ATP-binding protein EcfA2
MGITLALLDEIVSWSDQSLALWQRDAIRRLFQNSLNSEALDELYLMLKASHGIAVPSITSPIPLSRAHIPVIANTGKTPVIRAIKEVSSVNKLLAGERLEFGATGITLIYGENGAGKSGYTRILKRACRSRDGYEVVMPDVTQDPETLGIPSATFEVEVEGKTLDLKWASDKPSPEELAGIAVFDTHSARAHLDEDQEVVYVPFGLDIVENLARVVIPEIEERLDLEIGQISTTSNHLKHLLGNTEVGKLLEGLSANTDLTQVSKLANLTSDDLNRIEELNKIIHELDPLQKAQNCALQIRRFTLADNQFAAVILGLNDDSILSYRKSSNELKAAIDAELLASKELRSEESSLPGTGDLLWKTLYESAKNYSLEIAYPDCEFPHIDPVSQCVFCQQKIDQSTAERLERFKKYIEADVAKAVASKRKLHQEKFNAINGLGVPVNVSEETLLELVQFNELIGQEISDLNSSLDARRKWLLAIDQPNQSNAPPAINNSAISSIKKIVSDLDGRRQEFIKAASQSEKEKLISEFNELQARRQLFECQQSVCDLVNRLKIKAALEKCKADLKTRHISEKAKALATAAVTSPLRAALKEELKDLGVSALKTKIEERVEKGRMKHRLELDAKSEVILRDVLSEGEQRAIAIAAFLAELRAAGHSGGIVFDDPVSSLDHFRRTQVAKRLVREAKNRQVIIFTHDTVFLSLLSHEVENSNIELLVQNLRWSGSSSGKVLSGLPWDHMKFNARLDKLKQFYAELRRDWTPYPDEILISRMRERYSNLRATIERFIEERVFNGVIERYRDWIKVGSLNKVVGFNGEEFKAIDRLHHKCCDVTEAHDQSSAKNMPIPSPVDFGDDIKEFERIVNLVSARMNGN